ncbi:DUF4855 domain-containing protein [Fodinisporobacter ferrooxydans]|uniref:DUF4855 domain-containing protein n=1 Tax=Fodinisporobacter ferrooxydans TaxID=2901836 RepID=A0ABY4CQR1_9BACL|nr:DUF4855 domain-containing protein [Alicyclobacillaceae bacterium MYW30-H2]
MKKLLLALVLLLPFLAAPLSAFAATAYPKSGTDGITNLFLTYTGYSPNGDGTSEEQHWKTNDFLPILTHIDRTYNHADGLMFTDYLFTAVAVKDGFGQLKNIAQMNDGKPATPSDWKIYMNQLFQGNDPAYYPENIGALYDASLHNGLTRAIPVNVWIALPYPDPKVFSTDSQRISALENWMDLFIYTWNTKGYASNFQLKGFYWIGETVADTADFKDTRVIQAINDYIHNKAVNKEDYSALWIPYEGATGWNQWANLHFDLSFLQPNYYFYSNKDLTKGVFHAYSTNQGVEMEFDLGVTWDYKKDGYRSKFLSYMNQGVTGVDRYVPQYFAPYQPPNAALAWYTGGWWWSHEKRDQSILKLFRTGDKLYDSLYSFLNGTYKVPVNHGK